jgi:thymidylate kinase
MESEPRGELLRHLGGRLGAAELRVAVLRGDGSLPEPGAGDLDVLVHPQDAERAAREARDAAGQLGWRSLFEERVDNHHHLVWWHPAAVGEPAGTLHLDLQRALGRKGFRYAAAEPFLEETVAASWLPALAAAPRAVALALHAVLDKAAVREGERAAIGAAGRVALERFAGRVLPPRAAAALVAWIAGGAPSAEVPHLARVLRRVLARARPANLVRPVVLKLRRGARLAGPRRGVLVAFLGPDGSGKSTIVEAVARAIPAGPYPVRAVYLGKRETFLPTSRLIRMIHDRRGPRDLRRGPPGSETGGWRRITVRAKDVAGLANWWLEQWARYLVHVRPALQQGGVVLADRYAFDVANREETSVVYSPRVLRALPRLFPVPDRTYLLWETPDVLHARKTEVSPREAATLLERLRRVIAAVPRARELRTDRPLDETVVQIATEVSSLLERRCR